MDKQRQTLSDLMDGRLDARAVDDALGLWRGQPQARADWHAYHVIGDVLRTAELAPPAHRVGDPKAHTDEAFLRRLRDRLAQEPVVLAPAALPAAAAADGGRGGRGLGSTPRWQAPAAVAAGLMAVVGVLVATSWTTGRETARTGVVAGVTVTNPQPVSSLAVEVPRQAVRVNDQRMIRDAQLDRYLAQHRQFNANTAAAAPGGVVRSVSTLAPDR